MNWLLITVGTSAITNSDLGRAPDYRDNRTLMGQVSRYERGRNKTVEANQQLFDRLVAAHKEYWTASKEWRENPRHVRQTSAELYSTATLLAARQEALGKARLCLLSSDTDDGWFATQINHRIMVEVWGRLDVQAYRINNCDVRIEGTPESLKQFFSETLRIRDDDSVYCNITGGYKGTIPFLTLIAQERGWRLFYQHEESQEAVCVLEQAIDVVHPPHRARL